MKKQKQKEAMKYLDELVEHYSGVMNLNNWQIRTKNVIKEKSSATMTTTFVDQGYTNIVIRAYAEYFKMYENKDWETIRRSVIHELTHVLVRDWGCAGYNRFTTKDELLSLEERLCDNLSVIIEQLERE